MGGSVGVQRELHAGELGERELIHLAHLAVVRGGPLRIGRVHQSAVERVRLGQPVDLGVDVDALALGQEQRNALARVEVQPLGSHGLAEGPLNAVLLGAVAQSRPGHDERGGARVGRQSEATVCADAGERLGVPDGEREALLAARAVDVLRDVDDLAVVHALERQHDVRVDHRGRGLDGDVVLGGGPVVGSRAGRDRSSVVGRLIRLVRLAASGDEDTHSEDGGGDGGDRLTVHGIQFPCSTMIVFPLLTAYAATTREIISCNIVLFNLCTEVVKCYIH